LPSGEASNVMQAQIYPEGYHAINPILRVEDARTALDFYVSAFGAIEDFRRELDGRLLLAVIKIGDARLMLFDGQAEPGTPIGGDPRGNGLVLKLYVENVDAIFACALEAGARQDAAVEDKYFGERSGTLTDPFGFSWQIATFKENVPHDEIERRMREDRG
jgi:PhnB protein